MDYRFTLIVAALSFVVVAGEPDAPPISAGAKGIDKAFNRKAPSAATQPLAPEIALKQFNIPDGLAIDLIAAEPTIRQPLYMTFDARGRLWVTEYIQYPFPANLKIIEYDDFLRAKFDRVPPAPPKHFPGTDRVTILEDADSDGTFEKSKVFIEGLSLVTAALPGRGGVWVMNPPYLLFYPDADGDDAPDSDPQVHLSGFGLEDTHAVANSLHWGPDGWLYGGHGSTCTAKVKVEIAGAQTTTDFLGQAIWRYHPRSHAFEIFAEGGGNTFGVEFDDNGFIFSGTNHGKARGLHFVQGGYYLKSWGKHGPLTNPYALGWFEHMPHSGDADRFTHTMVIYGGGLLADSHRNKLITINPLQRRLQISTLDVAGSSFKTTDDPFFMTTSDGWFRPVDIKTGPDGAIYLADFYEGRITHLDPRDTWDRKNGRIYRIRPRHFKAQTPPKLSEKTLLELIDALSASNRWQRQTALRLLGERGDKGILPELLSRLRKESGQLALECLWAIHLCGGLDEALALETLQHPNAMVRFWTVRLLGDRRQASTPVAESLRTLARTETNVHVRSQLASSARRLPAVQCLPIVAQLLTHTDDANDPHIPLLLWWAIESKAENGRNEIATFLSEPSIWNLPLTQTCVLERLMQRYAMAGGDENMAMCAQLLQKAPTPKAIDAFLFGLDKAFAERSSGAFPPALKKALIQARQRGATASTVALDVRAGTPGATENALKALGDEKTPKAKRAEYVRLCGDISIPECVPVLLSLLAKADDRALQTQILGALQRYDDPSIGARLIESYAQLPDKDGVRAAAQTYFAARKSTALIFLEAIDSAKIDARGVPLKWVRKLKLHDDARVEALIEKHFGRVQGATAAEKQNEMDRLSALLSAGKGEAAKGKPVFAATCAKCHVLFGEGAAMGPDLTGYERTLAMFWIENIVDPNAAIREEFTNFVVRTKDGQVLTGILSEQNKQTVTLKTLEGAVTRISRENIAKLKASPQSLMPEDQLNTLSDQQIRDLFAYLMSTPK